MADDADLSPVSFSHPKGRIWSLCSCPLLGLALSRLHIGPTLTLAGPRALSELGLQGHYPLVTRLLTVNAGAASAGH